jgi:hypothetical protein
MTILRILVVVTAASLSHAAIGADESKDKARTSEIECTLYTKPYKPTEHGAFALPKNLKWQVMPQYVGRTEKGEQVVDDRLTLVLVDAESRFWPVIAKMSVEEAEQLQRDLAKVIAQKRIGHEQKK